LSKVVKYSAKPFFYRLFKSLVPQVKCIRTHWFQDKLGKVYRINFSPALLTQLHWLQSSWEEGRPNSREHGKLSLILRKTFKKFNTGLWEKCAVKSSKQKRLNTYFGQTFSFCSALEHFFLVLDFWEGNQH